MNRQQKAAYTRAENAARAREEWRRSRYQIEYLDEEFGSSGESSPVDQGITEAIRTVLGFYLHPDPCGDGCAPIVGDAVIKHGERVVAIIRKTDGGAVLMFLDPEVAFSIARFERLVEEIKLEIKAEHEAVSAKVETANQIVRLRRELSEAEAMFAERFGTLPR